MVAFIEKRKADLEYIGLDMRRYYPEMAILYDALKGIEYANAQKNIVCLCYKC